MWGKEDTIITVQIDYALAQRFSMTYTDFDGERKHPIIIHRSSIGCYERTMALLIEQYQGKFPFWLAPQQVEIVAINDSCLDHAYELKSKLNRVGLRSAVCEKNDTLKKKVRNAQMMKIPVIVTLGDKEIESGTVSIRTLDGTVVHGVSVDSFIEQSVVFEGNRDLEISFR